MLDILPGHARMTDHLTMGYREAEFLSDTILSAKGAQIRGHEFHYSEWVQPDEFSSPAYAIKMRGGNELRQEGFASGNILASYVHVHFASNQDVSQNFVNVCQRWRTQK